MFSIAVDKSGELRLVELDRPEPGPYAVVLKTEGAFICNATDRKVVDRHFPGLGVENYPLLLGHESVGRVVEAGSRVTSFQKGERVIGGLLLDPPGGEFKSGWGSFSEYVLARDHAAMVADGKADEAHGWDEIYQIMKSVPEDITIEDAGLLCTWREVYAGMFSDFHLQADDDILIFGAGPVGLSFIKFAQLSGLGEIICVDPLSGKRKKALQMGASAAFAPESEELADFLRTRKTGFDAMIDAVGRESIINQAVQMVKMGGSVCVYGVIGEPEINLKKALGPYNFNLLIHQWPTRDAEAAAQEPIIEWIRAGKLDCNDFVTGRFPVDKPLEAYSASQDPMSIKTMLVF